MRRIATLFLLALAARAEKIVVRVVVGTEPVEGVGLLVVPGDRPLTFHRNTWAPKTRTDRTGQAVLEVGKGDRVVAYRPGHALAVSDADRSPLDIALRRERVFAGRLRDVEGKPVAGIPVRLRTVTKRRAVFLSSTDARGRFFVPGLWLDNYVVVVASPEFAPVEQRVEGLSFDGRVRRMASFAGTVVDPDGKPVAGVSLTMADITVRTGADGAFLFPRVPPGSTHLAAAAPFRVRDQHARFVVLKDGARRAGETVVVLPPARATLRVVDPQDKPLRDVLVETELAGGEPVRTDEKGAATFLVRASVAGAIEIRRPGCITATVEFPGEPPGRTRDLGDIVLKPEPAVTVLVTRHDGKPATGRIGPVALPDGRAVVTPGHHVVEVDGYAPHPIDVQAPGPVRVTLPEPRWLEGEVVDPDGTPVANMTVFVDMAGFETDAKGRFRAGPLRKSLVRVTTWNGFDRLVRLGEGRLRLEDRPRTTEILRGRVLRADGTPVERFLVDHVEQIDEGGRFETTIHRSHGRGVVIHVDGIERAYEFPPPGEELVVRIPGGHVVVALEGAAAGEPVELWSGGSVLRKGKTNAEGTVRFDGLPDAVFRADAPQHAAAEVRTNRTVRLRAAPSGSLDLRLPSGFWSHVRHGTLAFKAGWHRQVSSAFSLSMGHILVRRVRIRAGETVSLDFTNGGRVLLRGNGESPVRFSAQWGDVEFDYTVPALRDAVLLPAGTYRVSCGACEQTLRVVAGEATRLDVAPGRFSFRSRVLDAAGRGVGGVPVVLQRAGSRLRIGLDPTDPAGRFVAAALPAGDYAVLARLPGYAPARARVVIDRDGRRTETGLPLRLLRSAGIRYRILGRRGEPLAEVSVRVDGLEQRTDALGYVTLDRLPATLDVDLAGYASVRGHVVRRAGSLRLVQGADLVVRFDPAAGAVQVRAGGRVWPAPAREGEIRLRDLPPGPVDVRQLPQDEDGEPDIVQSKLRAGERLTIDLRGG